MSLANAVAASYFAAGAFFVAFVGLLITLRRNRVNFSSYVWLSVFPVIMAFTAWGWLIWGYWDTLQDFGFSAGVLVTLLGIATVVVHFETWRHMTFRWNPPPCKPAEAPPAERHSSS